MNGCISCLLVFVSASATPLSEHSTEADSDGVETIRSRVAARYLPNSRDAFERLAATAETYAYALHENGSWQDIDYACKARSRWKTCNHLARVRDMAIACSIPDSPVEDRSALKTATLSALDFWFDRDFRNPNWWWNEIGVQLALGPTLLVLDGTITPTQKNEGIEIMKRSKWSGWSGQNLVWGATLQVIRGCIEGSPEVIQEAYDRMYSEVRIAKPGEEGVQADFSFHQHGSQLYSGGYGLGFASYGAEFIHHARETQFAASDEVVAVMENYLLDGQQWMMRGLTFDYSAVGREITRPGKDGASMELAASRLAELGGPRSDELKIYAQRMGAGSEDVALSGNRHFWRSDYTVHHRPGYFVSVRTASKRNRRSEITNREGRKSHHLADGVMYVYRDGKEYFDIFPVWDWQRIPGTTCEQMDWTEKGKVGGTGETRFVGGVSDGKFGLAALDFRRGALKAKKAWFCFDDATVCLGAGITCDSTNDVLTSVNQCHLKGDVLVSSSTQPLASAKHRLSTPSWVHHDSVGYVFPEKGTLFAANEHQTGKWSDIGTGPNREITLDVFSLWLDHGKEAREGHYAYVVYPAISVSDLKRCAAGTPFEILSNTDKVQAVRHSNDRLTQVVFWEAGALNYGEERFFHVDRPCLLMMRDLGDSVRIAVSNPLNEPLIVGIETDLVLKGDICTPLTSGGTRIVLTLPDGDMAGSSLVREFTRDRS